MLINGAKRTSVITFRLDEEVTMKLRKESKSKEVSTNTLVNQALKQFLDWHVFQPHIGLVSINKHVLVKIFENLNEKEIIEMASTIGKEDVCTISLFMKGKINVNSFMSWFEMLMLNSSIKVSHSFDGYTHTYVMKHDLGKNWSLYHKIILGLVFEELFGKEINIEHNKSLFRFQFTE